MNLVRWVVGNPVFSVALTVLAYAAALPLHHRWRWIPPIVAACLPIVAVLLLAREPYVDYNRGGSFLTWWLGPATVALAAPMYRHGMALRSSLPKLVLIVLAGSVVGMATAGLTAWLLGAPLPVVMSTVPKSVTTPIAIEVCKELKGIPQITIALVILAGVLGASFGPPGCRRGHRLRGARHWDREPGAAIGDAGYGIVVGNGCVGGVYFPAGGVGSAVFAVRGTEVLG